MKKIYEFNQASRIEVEIGNVVGYSTVFNSFGSFPVAENISIPGDVPCKIENGTLIIPVFEKFIQRQKTELSLSIDRQATMKDVYIDVKANETSVFSDCFDKNIQMIKFVIGDNCCYIATELSADAALIEELTEKNKRLEKNIDELEKAISTHTIDAITNVLEQEKRVGSVLNDAKEEYLNRKKDLCEKQDELTRVEQERLTNEERIKNTEELLDKAREYKKHTEATYEAERKELENYKTVLGVDEEVLKLYDPRTSKANNIISRISEIQAKIEALEADIKMIVLEKQSETAEIESKVDGLQ